MMSMEHRIPARRDRGSTWAWTGFLMVAWLLLPGVVHARSAGAQSVVYGVTLSAGGRYDNVRMCAATPAGETVGPLVDIALVADVPVGDAASISITVPAMRPLIFAASFSMLQFEPYATLNLLRQPISHGLDVVMGPSLGLSLHYGPDHESGPEGADRGPSFFALGPRLGGYLGLHFVRPGAVLNFQVGLHPFVTPLWGIGDPDQHRGVVLGGAVDGLFRFAP